VAQWNTFRKIVLNTRAQVSLISVLNISVVQVKLKADTVSSNFFFAANSITLGRLSNRISADHEDVHVPVKKAQPKKDKVVVF